MPSQSADKIKERAEGGFKSKYITQTNSVSTPIIEHLSEGEQLEYLFYNSTKGFRIIKPGGEERTPDHGAGAWGKRFLAITDQRILYIFGQKDGDKVQSFDYGEIVDVEVNESILKFIIKFTTDDGREFKFAEGGTMAQDIEDAGAYINNRIKDTASTDERGDTRPTDQSASNRKAPQTEPDSNRASDDSSEIGRLSRNIGDLENSPVEQEPDTFESQATGKVNGKELTSTGGKMFKVGYFETPVAAWLDRSETVQYVLRNFVDGVEQDGTDIEPADNRRAVACITDHRLLFVIGGASGDDSDEVIAIPHDRILSASEAESELQVLMLSEEDELSKYRFPVKNTEELPHAIEYLLERSDSSILNQQVRQIEELIAEAQEHLENGQYDDAAREIDQATKSYKQYDNIADKVNESKITEKIRSLTVPKPDKSKSEVVKIREEIETMRWEHSYNSHLQSASELREEAEDGEKSVATYEEAIEEFEAALRIATEQDVGNPEAVRKQRSDIHQSIYRTYQERAENLRTEAEQLRDDNTEKAVTRYTEALEALEHAYDVATEYDVGNPDTITEHISDIQRIRDDIKMMSLGQQVSAVTVSDSGELPADTNELEATITELRSLIERIEGLDVDRTEDIELIRDEAEAKLALSRLKRERYRAIEASEVFQDGNHATARELFEDVTENLRTLVSDTADATITEYESEINDLVDICEENVDVARKVALGLADESDLRPVDSEESATEYDSDTPVESVEQLTNATPSKMPGGGTETASFDATLTYDDIEKIEQIGSGGNADVYRASVVLNGTKRTVALKEPRMQGTLHTDSIERFISEAETWSKLDSHANIVSVLGYDSAPLPWIALEYMERGDLNNERPKLAFTEKFRVSVQITDAVWHAHQRGIAHLDLKPENILFKMSDDDTEHTVVPKIADWGLAKMLLNHSKSVEGLSPRYSAPEQFDDSTYGSPDNQTDIYQLGLILYELFTDYHPFEGTPSQVMHSVLHEDPEPPSGHAPELPEQLDEILLKALSKVKTERYEAMVYFRDALQEVSLQ